MITFTPLSGSATTHGSSLATSPVSYLLELDDVKILLDLGGADPRLTCEGDYDSTYERKIRDLAPSIDLLLLSHSPTSYTSLYPYARTHWNLKCPVYATQPTAEIGRLVCLEEAEGWINEVEPKVNSKEDECTGPFICTPEEINEAFDQVKAIRYSQPIHLSGLLSHLLLTPHPSGQTLGGSLFKLRSPTSGTLLYAIGLNHTTERHLNGTVLLSPSLISSGGLGRPDLLLVEGGRSLRRGAKVKDRVGRLLDLINDSMRRGEGILFPVDPSPRLLELLVLLDQHWAYQISQSATQVGTMRARIPLWNYPLCLVSRNGEEAVRVARSLMEWMGGNVASDEGLGSAADNARSGNKRKRPLPEETGESTTGALKFRHLRFFHSIEQYEEEARNLNWGPRCVLAVPISMNYGFSRQLFAGMAGSHAVKLILTGRSEEGTLAQEIFERWNEVQGEQGKYGTGKVGDSVRLFPRTDEKPSGLSGAGVSMRIRLNRKTPLQGQELEDFLEIERLAKEKEAAAVAAKERSRRMLEADDLESDSDDSDDGENDAGGLDPNEPDSRDLKIGATGTGAGNPFMETDDVRNTSFDIYVKGQQVRTTGFFKSTSLASANQGSSGLARFRMFPFVERKGRRVDVYGEGIDVGAWVRKGREIEEDQESDEVKEAKRKKKEEEEKAKEPPEPPSKYEEEDVEIQLNCEVFYVDMEGQHDGRAIKTIIPQLNPRKLIMIRSYEEATDDLLVNLHAITNLTKEIYAPGRDEIVTIGEQTQSYSISLSESLMTDAQGRWSKFEDYEVAKVSGQIHIGTNMSIPVLELPIKDEQQVIADVTEEAVGRIGTNEISYTLRTTTQSVLAKNSPAHLPQTLFIGDLRLNALKAKLSSMSIPAEFAGEGMLICGPGVPALLRGDKLGSGMGSSVVAVRKTAEGKIEMEGNVGEIYYNVRSALYGNFAQVVM